MLMSTVTGSCIGAFLFRQHSHFLWHLVLPTLWSEPSSFRVWRLVPFPLGSVLSCFFFLFNFSFLNFFIFFLSSLCRSIYFILQTPSAFITSSCSDVFHICFVSFSVHYGGALLVARGLSFRFLMSIQTLSVVGVCWTIDVPALP